MKNDEFWNAIDKLVLNLRQSLTDPRGLSIRNIPILFIMLTMVI